MKVTGLNGREYNLDLKKYIDNNRSKRSFYHVQARGLIKDIFKGYTILEEVTLPGSKDQFGGKSLRADMFLPASRIIVEVHGEQHYKFNNFFFKSKLDFYKAKARDSDKREWCELNEIELIELNYNEDIDEWREKIRRVSSND